MAYGESSRYADWQMISECQEKILDEYGRETRDVSKIAAGKHIYTCTRYTRVC